MTEQPLNDITGVILVGGKSRRMGQDKAFLMLDGQPLIERLLGIFRQCFTKILLAGNDGERYSSYQLPVVSDIYPGSSMGGLYSGLFYSEDHHIFVASCDMIAPNPAVIRRICSFKDDADAVIPLLSHGYEPLCAVYSKQCLPAMKAQLESGNARIFDFYPQMNIKTVRYEELAPFDSKADAFLSVNTPEELEAFKRGELSCR
jgi:molybdenum cofactor guanylyltransferase